MYLITAAVYGIALFLLMISMLTTAGTSKKVKNAAYYVANDLAYALIVFCTPNIISAMCI